jgi:hypothetical protein
MNNISVLTTILFPRRHLPASFGDFTPKEAGASPLGKMSCKELMRGDYEKTPDASHEKHEKHDAKQDRKYVKHKAMHTNDAYTGIHALHEANDQMVPQPEASS